MHIRTGIVGLQSYFWPHAFANCLNSISEAELVACISMGLDPSLNITGQNTGGICCSVRRQLGYGEI